MTAFAVVALSQAVFSMGAIAQDAAITTRDVAVANRQKAKTPPRFVSGPRAQLPDSEKALGHHGEVLVEGIVEVDGRMDGVSVKTSSGVPALDNIAVQAAEASQFTPAMDESKSPLPILVSMPFSLVAYKSQTGGAWEYRCDQFVRDMVWWRSANPEKPYREHELYKMYLGFSMLSILRQAQGDQERLTRDLASWDTKWEASIEHCRRKPKALYKDVILG